eukprot:Nk52_evm5s266 gene=Nk52_evmTU5s266
MINQIRRLGFGPGKLYPRLAMFALLVGAVILILRSMPPGKRLMINVGGLDGGGGKATQEDESTMLSKFPSLGTFRKGKGKEYREDRRAFFDMVGTVEKEHHRGVCHFPDEVDYSYNYDVKNNKYTLNFPTDESIPRVDFVLTPPVNKRPRGVITCAGGREMLSVVVAVFEFQRNVLKSKLPFHLFYAGEGEFFEEAKERLDKISDTTYSDISKIVPMSLQDLHNYRIKGFAVPMSPFKETIFIDSDFWAVYTLLDDLFLDEKYLETGALFFKDKILDFPNYSKLFQRYFIKHFIGGDCVGDPVFCEQSYILSGKCPHDQHSAILVVKTDWNSPANVEWFTMLMLLNHAKSVLHKSIYHWIYYDKETFWISREIVKQPYYFVPDLAALIGKPKIGGDKRDCLDYTQMLSMYKDKPLGYNKKGEDLRKYKEMFSHWNPNQERGVFIKNRRFETFSCVQDPKTGGALFNEFTPQERKYMDVALESAIELNDAILKNHPETKK